MRPVLAHTASATAIVAGKACSAAGTGGWCWQRPLPQGNFIADYAFVDDSRGWAESGSESSRPRSLSSER